MSDETEDIYRVSEGAQLILDEINRTFNENGIDLPERQYLTVGGRGSTAHDDEQVTVGLMSTTDGLPGNNVPTIQSCSRPFQADFVCEIVRCTPKGTGASGGLKEIAPSAEAIHEYGKERMIDVWLLSRVAQHLAKQSWLGANNYTVTTGQESGHLQGVILTITTVV